MEKIEINPKTRVRLMELLAESNKSQTALANVESIHCSQQHLNRIVQGKSGLSPELASEIANFFCVRPEWLLGQDDHKTAGAVLWDKFENHRLSNHKRITAFFTLIELSGYKIETISSEEIPRGTKTKLKTKLGVAYRIKKDNRVVGYCSNESLKNLGLDMQELAEQRISSYLREFDNG